LLNRLSNNQSGRVTFFGILIVLMLIISFYGLNTIHSDWNKIKLIPIKVRIANELRRWIAGVDITIDNQFMGQTNDLGEITALIDKPGNIHIVAQKQPYHPLDTTISLPDKGLDVSFLMSKPFAALQIVALNGSGEPIKDAKVLLNKNEFGQTDENGSLLVNNTLHLLDSVEVRLSKDGFENQVGHVYLADVNQKADYTMVKKTAATVAAPIPKPKPPAPKPDFQSHYDLANQYLDKAIAGDSKFYGRALSEINTAINASPKHIPAKQLKVEILYNFAKSLRDSKLYNEAANRCGEALKVYKEIPEDQMFNDIQKLKTEIDKKLN
jgi:hypothetical protein